VASSVLQRLNDGFKRFYTEVDDLNAGTVELESALDELTEPFEQPGW